MHIWHRDNIPRDNETVGDNNITQVTIMIDFKNLDDIYTYFGDDYL